MKKSIILILVMCLLTSLVSCVTPQDDYHYGPVHEGPIEPIVKVIEVPNTSKDELYILANDWLTNVSEGAIEFTDKESGISKVKIYIPKLPIGDKYLNGYAQPIVTFEYGIASASLKIEVKDNKARISIIYVDTCSEDDGRNVGTRIYELGYTNYINKCNAKIKEFEKFLSNSNSNW